MKGGGGGNSALGRQTYDEPVFTGIQGLCKLDFHPLVLIQTVSSLILTPNSVASVVGHGFLSRHLIAPHWDLTLFQKVKELFNKRLLYAIISLTIRELTLLLSHMQDSNLLRYEPLMSFSVLSFANRAACGLERDGFHKRSLRHVYKKLTF